MIDTTGTGITLSGGRWSAHLSCDWLQLFQPRRWNWLNFCLIALEPEWDRALGMVKLDTGLLGFRFYVSYTYNEETPLRAEIDAMLDFSKCKVSVPFDDYEKLQSDAAKWRALEAGK